MRGEAFSLGGALALVTVMASAAGIATRRGLARYWSFEARLARTLGVDSIVCVYQPILRLSDGRIVGCEVLARWRDVDDTLVGPGRFIPAVETLGRTLDLTRCVAARAHDELARLPATPEPIQINFNIFPVDLDAERLLSVFAPFLAAPDRFKLVLEIIETDQLPFDRASAEIDALRAAGVEVYIDDFGTGYFSVENLAHLAISGVKLDRAFAMAPDNSVMSRMLAIAIEMVAATGRLVVVEGVETAERLASLRHSNQPVHFAQGYHIGRPQSAEALAGVLAGGDNPARA